MTEAELNILADKIALKMEHITCPLGMDADAVKAAQMLTTNEITAIYNATTRFHP